jgi:hypothetical protein
MDGQVREQAVSLVGDLAEKNPEARSRSPALSSILREGDVSLVASLGKCGVDAGGPVLQRLQHHPNPAVRQAAATTLASSRALCTPDSQKPGFTETSPSRPPASAGGRNRGPSSSASRPR